MFMQLLANGLVTGSVIALAAAGVSIVYGILRLVNFAYGQLVMAGAFALAVAAEEGWQDPLSRKALQFIERRQRNRAAIA